MSNLPATYASAGVNIEAGNELVRRIKPHAKRTHIPGVLGGLGGFGALFQHDFSQYQEPILVSATDGVGTKLKIAFDLKRHDTVGRDLVAMCVNDLICLGAKPLFFLDYFATGQLAPDDAENVVKGIADGCVEAGCALIGGETAELPGFYAPGEYDLAGFTVGVVDKPKIIDGAKVEVGDAILGLSSSGLHSNGYSLARKILEPLGYETFDETLGATIGDALLTPTQIYIQSLGSLIENIEVKAIANITGGGFYENIPRALPANTRAEIKRGSWPIAPIFELIQTRGNVAEREMFTTFNMGIGMVAVVAKNDVEAAISHLKSQKIEAFYIGEVTNHQGDADVVLV
ncbi:phosphoribosylformylglycinamidine cyclo-ligase [Abditibacterium utsteinense]|uniref:Phosphoribosylformylglycinamidine cyclo-ligase n=1 Tax=Abditibacterium utsteinense TaxID=1960156 RepID=A0A2S8SPM4_9BACT|nr:phosphoribosylformylglycinamidine cyclo-ligase [Abditibacterium utsteinense]PQV62750.1 phosphoribosylformylglycinamidine cyclo-ligase [Abditibacterium utsteinense]